MRTLDNKNYFRLMTGAQSHLVVGKSPSHVSTNVGAVKGMIAFCCDKPTAG